MSEQRADYDHGMHDTEDSPCPHGECDKLDLLARVRRYEAALRSIADVPCNRSARDHEGIDRNIVAPHVRIAAAALADDAQPPAGE
jgi:hypothetical protein